MSRARSNAIEFREDPHKFKGSLHFLHFYTAKTLRVAKLSGIFLLKIKCPTRRTRPARPTHKQLAKREALHLTSSPLPSHPQVCGGEKCASPLQACVKCDFGVFQGGLWVALCRGCVISGNAKVQRYRQSRQCPPGWSGVLSPLHPSWATNTAAHRAAFCRLVCPVRVHSCVRLNQHQPTRKEQTK